MNYPFIETIPDVLKTHRPSVYTGESFTVLEYVSKNSAKLNEIVELINEFLKDVIDTTEEYKNNYAEKQDLFERVIEQRFSDFTNTIKLKFGSQDKVIDEAINLMLYNMPTYLEEAIRNMYENDEFNDIVLKAVNNLQAQFDNVVRNNTTYQNTMNNNFNLLSTEMENYKSTINSDIEEYKASVDEVIEDKFNEVVQADMTKAVYDIDNTGVVDNSERLGGQLPEYFAKQVDLETTNANLDILNTSVTSITKNVTTALENSSNANNIANEVKDQIGNKLDKDETASNTHLFEGLPIGEFHRVINGDLVSVFECQRSGTTGLPSYTLTGILNKTVSIILFTLPDDFIEDSYFIVNDIYNNKTYSVEPYNSEGEVIQEAGTLLGNTPVLGILNITTSKLYIPNVYNLDKYATKEDIENNGSKPTLLWENSSPTTAFKAQTISLDLSNYSAVEIEYRESTTINIFAVFKIMKGTKGRGITQLNYRHIRNTAVEDTGVIFEEGRQGSAGDSVSTHNESCIPTRIWGIK